VSGSPDLQPTWSLLLKIKKGDEIHKIVISETTGPIGTDPGPRMGLPDNILKENHQWIILAKLESMIGPVV
jgi:hypothetical protein